MFEAAIRYFNRASWAFRNSTNIALPPDSRSHLLASAVHACQSLKEALDQVAANNGDNVDLQSAIKNLPHAKLIENVRNMDLHGRPIPLCDPRIQSVELVSKPGHPVSLSSAGGVGLSLSMQGPEPKVRRFPNDLKKAKIQFGGATVSFGCDQGRLFVYDVSTGKTYLLEEVLANFLSHSHTLLSSRGEDKCADSSSTTNGPTSPIPRLVKSLYRIVDELGSLYPGRRFTPDGHLVGSIGEVLAALAYDLELLPASSERHDATARNGTLVQIKATQIKSIALYGEPDHLLVLRLGRDGSFEEIYNGPGSEPWANAGKETKNGQRRISFSRLRKLMTGVRPDQRIPQSEAKFTDH